MGFGWRLDHESWGGELPAREWIDSVTGNHPVFVSRYDGHMAFANSQALQLAEIPDNIKSPRGGEIIRNKNGDLLARFKLLGIEKPYTPGSVVWKFGSTKPNWFLGKISTPNYQIVTKLSETTAASLK